MHCRWRLWLCQWPFLRQHLCWLPCVRLRCCQQAAEVLLQACCCLVAGDAGAPLQRQRCMFAAALLAPHPASGFKQVAVRCACARLCCRLSCCLLPAASPALLVQLGLAKLPDALCAAPAATAGRLARLAAGWLLPAWSRPFSRRHDQSPLARYWLQVISQVCQHWVESCEGPPMAAFSTRALGHTDCRCCGEACHCSSGRGWLLWLCPVFWLRGLELKVPEGVVSHGCHVACAAAAVAHAAAAAGCGHARPLLPCPRCYECCSLCLHPRPRRGQC